MNNFEKLLLEIHKNAEVSKYILLLLWVLLFLISSIFEVEIYTNQFIIFFLLLFLVKGLTGLLLGRNYNFGPKQMYIKFKERKLRFDFKLKVIKGINALFLNLLEIFLSILIIFSIR